MSSPTDPRGANPNSHTDVAEPSNSEHATLSQRRGHREERLAGARRSPPRRSA